jgi:hypothetical protein
MIKKIFFYSFLLLGAGSSLTSCKKETPVAVTKSGTSVFQTTAKITDHTRFVVDGILATYGVKGYVNRVPDFLLNTCASLSVDTSGSPHIAVLDYGSGCTEMDGTFYAGKLTITYPDADVQLSNPNTTIQIVFDNYLVDSMLTNGTLDYNNLGYNGSGNLHGNLTFNFSIVNNIINKSVTGTFLQQFQELPSGEIEFTGGLGATDGMGVTYNQSIIDPLWMGTQSGCNELFIKGIVRIEESGQPDYFIDYGTGGCDDIAFEVRGGVRTQISAGEEVD